MVKMSHLWLPYCGQFTYGRWDIFFFLFTKCLILFILCIHAETNYLTWINLVIYSSYFFSSHPVVADVIFTLYLKVALLCNFKTNELSYWYWTLKIVWRCMYVSHGYMGKGIVSWATCTTPTGKETDVQLHNPQLS